MPTLYEELNKTTRLLCELCEKVEGKANLQLSTELIEWWEHHKKVDAKRKAAEKESAARQAELARRLHKAMRLLSENAARRAALNKLSPEERKLLGL
jgi:ABC-type transport system involved in cytochrome c biogenesis ATPase subunit